MSTVTPITAQHILDTLYGDVQGYSLSSQGRTRIAREADPAFTYGEVTPEAIEYIVTQVQPKEHEVFYDLGAGTGKGVVFASFFGPFSRSIGIELLPELWAAASDTATRYELEVKPQLPPHKHGQQIEFRNGDIFVQDISDADVVFSHCTCFDDELMGKLSDQCRTLKSGARIVTVTKGLVGPEFIALGTTPFRMAWGDATICFYQRA